MRSTYLVWANDIDIESRYLTGVIRINSSDVSKVSKKLYKYGYSITKLELGIDWNRFYRRIQREEKNRKARIKYRQEHPKGKSFKETHFTPTSVVDSYSKEALGNPFKAIYSKLFKKN